MNLYLYGPPGSGKTTVGRYLAQHTGFGFVDLDTLIEAMAERSIPQIFEREGELGFRHYETAALEKVASYHDQVIALGGGALLDPQNRSTAEKTGLVFCLQAEITTLLKRLNDDDTQRPLLAEDQLKKLENLLDKRGEHYHSFYNQITTDHQTIAQISWEIQKKAGIFLVKGMDLPYEVRVEENGLARIGEILLQKGFRGHLYVLTDENVAQYYLQTLISNLAQSGFKISQMILPPGEQTKTIGTLQALWGNMVEQGLDRSSILIALGGGVVSDIGGFVSATFMRGIPWIVIPTSLLAMVDASLGGKTGVDLPNGKNLVGAFYAPRYVLADPQVLSTLPEPEMRSGLAEVVKSAVIGDVDLFDLCATGWENVLSNLGQIIQRSMAVKIKIIQDDPYEKRNRAILNYGHTVGHAIECLSKYSLPHGLCVAMGMVAETRLAEELNLAHSGLSETIKRVLNQLGLPNKIPASFLAEDVIAAMRSDKKKSEGSIRFSLPIKIGEVKSGFIIEDTQLLSSVLKECQE